MKMKCLISFLFHKLAFLKLVFLSVITYAVKVLTQGLSFIRIQLWWVINTPCLATGGVTNEVTDYWVGTRGVKSNWKWSSSVNSNNNHTSCYVWIKAYPSLLLLSFFGFGFGCCSYWVSISYDYYRWALWKYIVPLGDHPPKGPCAQQGFDGHAGAEPHAHWTECPGSG